MSKKIISEKLAMGIVWGGITHPLELLFGGVVPVFWGITFKSVFFGVIRLANISGPIEEEPVEVEEAPEEFGWEPQTYIPDPYCDCEICRNCKE